MSQRVGLIQEFHCGFILFYVIFSLLNHVFCLFPVERQTTQLSSSVTTHHLVYSPSSTMSSSTSSNIKTETKGHVTTTANHMTPTEDEDSGDNLRQEAVIVGSYGSTNHVLLMNVFVTILCITVTLHV